MTRLKLIFLAILAMSFTVLNTQAQQKGTKDKKEIAKQDIKTDREAYKEKQKGLLEDLSKNDKHMREASKKREAFYNKSDIESPENQHKEMLNDLRLERESIHKEKERIKMEFEKHQSLFDEQKKHEQAYYKGLKNNDSRAERNVLP